MRNLSIWAFRHAIAARLVIIFSQLMLAILAVLLANQLAILDIHFPLWWMYLGFALFFISWFAYSRIRRGSAWRFAKQKTLDFLLAALGFFLVTLLADQLNQPYYSSSAINAATFVKDPPAYKNPEAQKLLDAFKSGEKTKFSAREKRIIRQEFKYQLKKFALNKMAGDTADAKQIALIILTCIAAVGLLWLIGSLACEVSCSGSDAGAVVIVVIGTAAVVWGTIAIIKAINRGAKKRQAS
jgi:hypothetical protein